jgi:hypothetical protein
MNEVDVEFESVANVVGVDVHLISRVHVFVVAVEIQTVIIVIGINKFGTTLASRWIAYTVNTSLRIVGKPFPHTLFCLFASERCASWNDGVG